MVNAPMASASTVTIGIVAIVNFPGTRGPSARVGRLDPRGHAETERNGGILRYRVGSGLGARAESRTSGALFHTTPIADEASEPDD
jgi:hypothetical protein